MPAEQAAQAPPWQTMSVPQPVPLGALPVSMHTGAPVLHAIVPRLQGFPGGVQIVPPMQAAQAPLALQTMSVPHDVPAATLVPLSVQDAAEPVQTSVPLWHLFVGVQAAPA